MPKLKSKVALITGGSRGIGASIARRLSEEGASVAFTYSNSKARAQSLLEGIEKSGGRALAIQADSAEPEAVRAAVRGTIKEFGGLDILVNNAGIATIGPIEDFSLEDFDRTLAVNVRGLFVATQEASRHLKSGGRIIHIGSVNGESVPISGFSVYALSKAAVAGFTRGLARDLGPKGITVNNVQPGPVDTELNPADGPWAETMRGFMALERYGKGEEVASLVAFLASQEASFITGASINIDGGFTA